ncbi:MAG: hypothetical protein ACI9UQ_000649 [Candidatus Krumholzibacteriia bacterium]
MFICTGIGLCDAGLAASLKFPESVSVEQSQHFIDRFSTDDYIYLRSWIGFDLKFVAEDEGLSGTQKVCTEVVLLSKKSVRDLAFVATSSSPKARLKKYEIEINGPSGHRKFKHKDLQWTTATSRSDGIVNLDEVVSTAFVQGLELGDHVKITSEHAIKSYHALMPRKLGFSDIPYLESSYELIVPDDYQIDWNTQGAEYAVDRLEYTPASDDRKGHHKWALSAGEEGALPECNDRYPYLTIISHISEVKGRHPESMAIGTTWAEIGAAYSNRISDVFTASPQMKATALSLTDDLPSRMDKIDALYTWVQKSCRYLGLFEGHDGIIPKNAVSVNELQSGDCKGLGTLLISMLRAIDIDAHPVLVLTGTGGARLDTSIPNMAQFNHYIAWADDGKDGIFLDCTVDFYPAGAVPLVDATSPVLLLKPGQIGLVSIPRSARLPGTGTRTAAGTIDDAGFAHLEVTYSVSDDLSRSWRNYIHGLNEEDAQRTLLKYLLPKKFAANAKIASLTGLEDWRAPLEMAVDLVSATPMPQNGDSYFLPLNLTQAAFDFELGLGCGKGYDLRNYSNRQVHWELEIPEGFYAESDSLAVAGPGINWTRKIWQSEGSLYMERHLEFGDIVTSVEENELFAKAMRDIKQAQLGYIELKSIASQ